MNRKKNPSKYMYHLILIISTKEVLYDKMNDVNFLFPEFADSILLLDLKIPPFVKEGESVKLECVYDLEYDGLYRRV